MSDGDFHVSENKHVALMQGWDKQKDSVDFVSSGDAKRPCSCGNFYSVLNDQHLAS